MSRRLHQWQQCAVATMAICILMTGMAHAIIIVSSTSPQPVNLRWLQLTKETVHANLSDRAAEISAEFTYHNSGPQTLEGTYIFPLPPGAAVDRFSLLVDGEEIHAELLDVEAARREYESIVRRIRDPALLEYAGRQLVKARIFPIRPRADATIRLNYTQPLIADFGTTDFVFPFSVEQRAPNADVSLSVEIATSAPLRAVTSPTHDVDVAYKGRHRAIVTSAPRWKTPNADFHLLCTYDNRELGAQFITTVDASGNRYFMGIIAPGEAPEDMILPKDVVFCFDRSGSMDGEKIAQARAALQFCLGKLNPADRFDVIVFNDAIEPYADALSPADADHIGEARAFVKRVDADGGTFIDGALQRSLELFDTSDRPKYLVFLTDGRPTVGERSDRAILDSTKVRNIHGVRIFTFGVGYDLNAGLLNDLAAAGKGLASYVRPDEDIEVAVSHFFRKISRPVLKDCRLVFESSLNIRNVYPRVFPDLFSGSEIIVLGRFDGSGKVAARIEGSRGNQSLSRSFAAEFTPQPGRYEFIPKLWAGRRIGYLLEDARKHGETDEVKSEIIRLSKKYGIMTPYTAFLAAPEQAWFARKMPLPQSGNVVDRAPIRMDEATTKRDIQSAQLIQSLPVTDVSQILARKPDSVGAQTAPSIAIPGKQFSLLDGYWTDWSLLDPGGKPADTITVKPYSDAYFHLARSPELARILTVGERLIFLWRNTVIRVDENGSSTWGPAWDRLL